MEGQLCIFYQILTQINFKRLEGVNLMNQIKNLSLFGICFAFVVIALGAWTRLVDAGLGCPDWPGCYGFVVFPVNEADIAIAESRYPLFPYDINKAIPELCIDILQQRLDLLQYY